MGEIPPYWTAYAAKMSGETDEVRHPSLFPCVSREFLLIFARLLAQEIDEVEQLGNADHSESVDPLTATKIWMVKFMKKWGFWGVFVMSAWPNALFDLCGICCGSCLMPFWHFFAACWLGKACVKAPLQLVVLVSVFSEHYRAIFIDGATAILPASMGANVEGAVQKLLEKSKGAGAISGNLRQFSATLRPCFSVDFGSHFR